MNISIPHRCFNLICLFRETYRISPKSWYGDSMASANLAITTSIEDVQGNENSC